MGASRMTFATGSETHPSSQAGGTLAGCSNAPAFFVAGVKAVTIERKRRKMNEWGLNPLLVERKTFKAIYIPFNHNLEE